MNDKNMAVLVNVIGAVESGGQVYGQRRYDAYAAPYTNSNVEHTVTLGWAQNYGSEAHKLIQMIYDADPEGFKKIDSKGSIKSMLAKDWVATRWNPTAAQKKILIALISSEAGKKCQDELFAQLMKTFIADCEKAYTKDIKAIMMYCEIRHLGGLGPVKRIFNRLNGKYDLDSIMASLVRDQQDKSSDNQVGDSKFWTRHLKCKEFIERYAVDESGTASTPAAAEQKKDDEKMTEEKAIQTAIDIATAEIGYLEKKSNAQLDDKTANAGSNNYTKYWRDVYPEYQALAWCACFVSWCLMKAFGKETAKKLLKHWPFVYCPTLAGMTSNKTPKVGSIVLFYRNGEYAHTGIVIAVTSTKITTIEGNTSGASGIIANGGGVCKKTYNRSDLNSNTKFFMPDYSIVTGVSGSTGGSSSSSSGSGKKLNTTAKWKGIVTDPTGANVRTWAGTENPPVSFSPLDYGAVMEICDTIKAADNTDWYYIKYNGKYGFLSASLIGKYSGESGGAPATPAGQEKKKTATFGADCGPDPDIAGTYKVTATELNVRNRPGSSTANGCYVIGTLPKGTKVRNYGYYSMVGSEKWLYVQTTYKGITYTGHCAAQYLKKV